jgi:hypothetical protein
MDRALHLLAEQLEARFVDGKNAGTAFDLGAWVTYC